MARNQPLQICNICYRRPKATYGQVCKVCKSDWIRIEAVRQLAMQRYPKLQKLTLPQFVEALWKKVSKKKRVGV